jgi:RNA polymerase sigma factor (sigma-70 family)
MGTVDDAYESLFLCAFRAAKRVLADRAAAADVASEAVARAFVHWKRVEDYAEPWVTRVAVNLALDVVRRRPVPLFVGRTAAAPTPDRVALAGELARLPRRQREAVVLRFLLDFDEEQTAAVLGLSVGTVHTHVTRGLARLRRDLPADFVLGGDLR